MTERLDTPWTHKLVVSPLGMLLDTRLFEWIKKRSLPREFRLARVGAAAAATVGEDVDTFLDALGVWSQKKCLVPECSVVAGCTLASGILYRFLLPWMWECRYGLLSVHRFVVVIHLYRAVSRSQR